MRMGTLFPLATDSVSTGDSSAMIHHNPSGWFFGPACAQLSDVP
jgi:hypothetical protein